MPKPTRTNRVGEHATRWVAALRDALISRGSQSARNNPLRRANASATVASFMVPTDPFDPASPMIPLSLEMLRDQSETNPYRARLDPGATGLPITEHQLGFTSPTGGGFIVRRAGENTIGYPERSYSLINRYQFHEGRLRGLTVGLTTSYQQKYRAWMYNDMLDGNRRKMFYFPDRFLNDLFIVYRFTPHRRIRSSMQLNVGNLFDANRVVMLRSSANGAFRYAQWFNAPRKLSVTSSWRF